VWQPAGLAARSNGICTQLDPDCSLTRRTAESELEDEDIPFQTQTITNSQAEAICETHVNAYLSKSRRTPYQRSASTNSTIANVLTGCKEDVIFTGQPEVSDNEKFIQNKCHL
jgi:hypothetical protein